MPLNLADSHAVASVQGRWHFRHTINRCNQVLAHRTCVSLPLGERRQPGYQVQRTRGFRSWPAATGRARDRTTSSTVSGGPPSPSDAAAPGPSCGGARDRCMVPLHTASPLPATRPLRSSSCSLTRSRGRRRHETPARSVHSSSCCPRTSPRGTVHQAVRFSSCCLERGGSTR